MIRLRIAIAIGCAALTVACEGGQIPIGAERSVAACTIMATDPFQQTALGPTDRSHWLQPWRAYQETWPARRMREAVGMPFGASATEPGRAQLLAAAGVTRGQVVFQWQSVEYDDPFRFDSRREDLRTRLRAMRAAGIRPLLTLYGHEGVPAPTRFFMVRVAEPAAKGATRLRLDRGSLPSIVPGRTGLADLTKYKASEVIFTAVDDAGTVTLSRPLPEAVPAGLRPASTLRYAPFSAPLRADGAPNPLFEETLRGWLEFVRGAVREAVAALGDDRFDVEIWNELATGADFLDINTYYDPPLADPAAQEGIPRAILTRTVAALRDPALGVPNLGIGDGFANTRWTEAASTKVAGVTALDRHVSVQPLTFPEDTVADESRALDATGSPTGARDEAGRWREPFVPRYVADFPELPLTAVLPLRSRRPGQLIRDLSPIVTLDANGVAHGRNAAPPDGRPPSLWITAMSTRPAKGEGPWFPADTAHFQSKAVLRTVAAYVGKGVEALHFYAPGGDLELVDFADPVGGEVLRTLGRFLRAFAGPPVIGTPRAISLVSVMGCAPGREFDGDGTARHPPLHHRELIAFFPFQVEERRWVAPVYVMTRSLSRLRRPPSAPADVLRHDLPATPFELTIEGVDGRTALIEATDPMTGRNVEITVTSRSERRVVVAVPLTDSPRLLVISEP